MPALELPILFHLVLSTILPDLGIINWCYWFSISLNKADRDSEFSIFWDTYLRRYSDSHLDELNQLRLIKQVLVTSLHWDHVTLKNYLELWWPNVDSMIMKRLVKLTLSWWRLAPVQVVCDHTIVLIRYFHC